MIIDPIKDGSDGVKHAKHFYIDPRSRFKFWWDIASLVCVGHSVIVLPFALAFLRFDGNEEEPMYSKAIGYLVDAFFWLDIGVTFYSAYYSSRGTLMVDLKVIRERYVKTWLALDLLAVFPFEIFVQSQYSKSAGFVKTDAVVEDHESGEVFRVEVPKFARIREIIFSCGEDTPIFGAFVSLDRVRVAQFVFSRGRRVVHVRIRTLAR